MLEKNKEIELTITDIGVGGEGIGKIDGIPFFVKDAVVGDHILAKVTKMKKHFGFARLLKVLVPSPNRVEPVCAIARPCGGCQIQALSYDKQLEFKQQLVENNLRRIGGFQTIPMEPIIGMEYPFGYRNKAQFPVGTDKDGYLITGFYAGRTHRIIPNRDCALGIPENKQILDIVMEFWENLHLTAYNETTGKGLLRHILIRKGFATGEIMVCLVINGDRVPDIQRLVAHLLKIKGMTSICLNHNRNLSNVILGEDMTQIYGPPYITDRIGEIQYQISAKSFFQVNPIQTKKLYDLALEYANLTGRETVWDLYCGIGSISLFLAQKAKMVYGVEIIPQAIENAKANVLFNHIANAEFYVGKAEEVLPAFYEREAQAGRKATAEVIVVDPPRKGCDATLLKTMLDMEPDRIVYVSCDSATLARDLKILCERDYRLERVRAVDQFGQTVHVETVCLMSRVKD